MPTIRKIAPADIEAESFRIIERELGAHSWPPAEFSVVRRVIHATADFSFAETMRFHPQAVAAGIAAIRAGRHVLTDINMVAAGVNKGLLEPYGGRVVCRVAAPGVAELAKKRKKTRTEIAIEQAMLDDIGIVAIGNAPTALLKVIDMIRRRQAKPDLVVGVPVGFVNAAEAKELLAEQDFPHITCLGRKGGTPVAVAVVNAILALAARED